jgi:hypothetical protein
MIPELLPFELLKFVVVGLVGGSDIGGFNRSVVFIRAPLLIRVVVLLVFPLQRFSTSPRVFCFPLHTSLTSP